MLRRNCAGGIVFYEDQVLLLQNDKLEWSFPKGVVRQEEDPEELALSRVLHEAGVRAVSLGIAGQSSYEFYSIKRQRPVHNQVQWYLMTLASENEQPNVQANATEGFLAAGFFPVEEALERITYSQDKSLLLLAYHRFRELRPVH